jgi:hypothetical protein
MKCIGGPMDGADFPTERLPDHGMLKAGISIRQLPLSEKDRDWRAPGHVWEWDENSPALVAVYLQKGDRLKYNRCFTPKVV